MALVWLSSSDAAIAVRPRLAVVLQVLAQDALGSLTVVLCIIGRGLAVMVHAVPLHRHAHQLASCQPRCWQLAWAAVFAMAQCCSWGASRGTWCAA